MIVLDTCVLSEPLKPIPEPKVIEWLDDQVADTLYISAVTCAELRFGVLRLPESKRKKDLAARVARVLDLFNDRTLPFDARAAEHLAQIAARIQKFGKNAKAPDAYIAATAAAHGFAVATRNVKDFEPFGVKVINPWG
jgi:hypothetical protein